MEATKARCLKPLTRLNPSACRTPQESRRLLSLLSSHRPEMSPALSADPSKSTRHLHDRSNSSSKDTDTHFSSILDHPLFRVVPDKPLPRAGRSSHAHDSGTIRKKIGSDPLGMLDELMASGRANHQVLYQCLRAHFGFCTSQNSPDAIRQSGVGSKIIAWYNAADVDSRQLFFGSQRCTAIVMPYLAAGGFHETVMGWLESLCSSVPGEPASGVTELLLPTRDSCFFNVLYEFIAAEIKYGHGIQSALKYFVRTSQIIPPDSDSAAASLRRTAFFLAKWISLHNQTPEVRGIPVPLFEDFIASSALSDKTIFWGALLALYHPTNPNAQHALEFMRRQSSNWKLPLKPSRRKHLLQLSLEAAHICLEQKRYLNSSWLMSLAKQLLLEEYSEAELQPGGLEPQTITYPDSVLNTILSQ
ncbi:hypothetical protein FQN53_006866 [Emmonsiellopsis sp. PD_33]|nr:hypothetical protein FQN53_006866 [Emmonsiellopsis sp. PD_33]KAK2786831.1 hypothetical protein FQN51_003476 [Onygenales sp. PD_10]